MTKNVNSDWLCVTLDAAFRLLYLILLDEFDDEAKDAEMMMDAVLFIVSHPHTFDWRTRRVVRMAFEGRFVVTEEEKDERRRPRLPNFSASPSYPPIKTFKFRIFRAIISTSPDKSHPPLSNNKQGELRSLGCFNGTVT